MSKFTSRSTVSFQPKVVAWLDREKLKRKHNPDLHPAFNGEKRPTRDGIIDQAVAVLSLVENEEAMRKHFGKDAKQVQDVFLEYLNSRPTPID